MDYTEYDPFPDDSSDDFSGWHMTDLSSTPLIDAVRAKDLATVRNILDNGANILARDGQGKDALQTAASINSNDEILKLVLDRGGNPNFPLWAHGKALEAAARANNVSGLQILFAHGATFSSRSGFGSGGPLQEAADVGKVEAVRLLLQHGADANPVIPEGMHGYPLQAAAQYGSEEAVQILLDAGANVNAVGGYHGTALQAAARYGRERLVKLLLASGADVNIQGGIYKNALESAVKRGHDNVARILLEAGAKDY
jgi:ankyrin repeat protein